MTDTVYFFVGAWQFMEWTQLLLCLILCCFILHTTAAAIHLAYLEYSRHSLHLYTDTTTGMESALYRSGLASSRRIMLKEVLLST